mmetsp:Transcript_26254/g.51769  ORF Transcript_26254/g.51769 Transcript_26254/m.51769 type:complete len:181 (+) Transcript_26254:319-861(+)
MAMMGWRLNSAQCWNSALSNTRKCILYHEEDEVIDFKLASLYSSQHGALSFSCSSVLPDSTCYAIHLNAELDSPHNFRLDEDKEAWGKFIIIARKFLHSPSVDTAVENSNSKSPTTPTSLSATSGTKLGGTAGNERANSDEDSEDNELLSHVIKDVLGSAIEQMNLGERKGRSNSAARQE